MCTSMRSEAKASWSCLLQPIYANSTTNTSDPWGSVFGNMVTKGYLWTSQKIVICRLADFIKEACVGVLRRPGSEGECVREAGSEGRRAGAWEQLCFQMLLPVQLRRESCNLAVS